MSLSKFPLIRAITLHNTNWIGREKEKYKATENHDFIGVPFNDSLIAAKKGIWQDEIAEFHLHDPWGTYAAGSPWVALRRRPF